MASQIIKKLFSSTAKSGYAGIFDQGVISGTTFITTLLGARYISPNDFGVFALCFSGLLLAFNFQSALITQPMVVLTARYEGSEKQKYLFSTFFQQLMLAIILALAASLIAFFYSLGDKSTSSAITILAMAATIFAYQLQEFFRRLLFTDLQMTKTLIGDAIGSLSRIGILMMLVFTTELTSSLLFMAMFAGYLISTFVLAIFGKNYFEYSLSDFKKTLARNWDQGRWLLGANLTTWMLANYYLFVVAQMLGTAETGALKAAQTILGPLSMLLQGIENFSPSMAAIRLKDKGNQSFKNFMHWLAILILACGGIFCVLVGIFSEELLDILYKGKYSGFGIVVIILAMSNAVGLFQKAGFIGLRVLRTPKPIFQSAVVASIAMLAFSYFFVKYLGVMGSALGTFMNTFMMAAMITIAFRKALESNKPEST